MWGCLHRESGWGVHPGRVRDADDDAFAGLQAGDGLAPGFRTHRVEQFVAGGFELLGGELHGVDIGHLELDAGLRSGPLLGPGVATETSLRRLTERPHTEVLRTIDVFAVDVVVAV